MYGPRAWWRPVHRLVIVMSAGALMVTLCPGRAVAVPPSSPQCRPPQNHHTIGEVPWHVRRYEPQRIWPVTTGAHVTVAV